MTTPARTIISGAGITLLFLLLCVAIDPHGLAANGGASYYGSRAATVVPYSLAFLASAASYWRAADLLQTPRLLAAAFRAMALLFVGLVLTPDKVLDAVHVAFGSTLFVLQLAVSFWLLARKRDVWNGALLGAQFAAGVAALIYLPRPQGLLLQTQLVFQLAFVVLCVRACNGRDLRPSNQKGASR